MFAGCGEQELAALQNHGNPAVWETSVAHTKKQSKLVPFFSLGDDNFADKTTPVLGSKNGPKNGVHSFSPNLICLCPGDLAQFLGSVFGPQNGGRFVGKIFAAGRQIVQVLIVSAGTRQRFCIPLGFHGFAAPRAIVRHALQTCMSAHVLEQFKNMCGHKCSQGVENKCSRRCKTMEIQRYEKLLSRT